MAKGIFAFFGVTKDSSLSLLDSYGRTFEMPYVTPSAPTIPPNRSAFVPNSYVLHMRPTYDEAMVDIIRHYKWPEVFYIYDNDEGEWDLLLYFMETLSPLKQRHFTLSCSVFYKLNGLHVNRMKVYLHDKGLVMN